MEKESVQVALLTPYLTIAMRDFSCPIDFMKQTMYGYDPDNLSDVEGLSTREREVNFYPYQPGRNLLKKDDFPKPTHLIIAGSSERGEREISSLMNSGLIVARYSIFHGHPSGYTGIPPEEAGYSLDIPKSVPIVKALLSDKNVLDALVSREEISIKSAITDLNKLLEAPIYVTPFLEEALK